MGHKMNPSIGDFYFSPATCDLKVRGTRLNSNPFIISLVAKQIMASFWADGSHCPMDFEDLPIKVNPSHRFKMIPFTVFFQNTLKIDLKC